MGRIIVLLSITFLGACGALSEVDASCECGFYQINGKMMHWPTDGEVKFSFNEFVPYSQRPAIVAAAEAYNELFSQVTLGLDAELEDAPDFPEEHTVAAAEKISGDGVNGVYWLEEPWPWNEESPKSDAMTLVKFDGNRIVEADIYFRARSFENHRTLATTQSEGRDEPEESGKFEPANARVDAQWIYVIGIHEFGHALGRVHSEHEESIMFHTVGLDSLKNPFAAYDLDVFSKVYSLR